MDRPTLLVSVCAGALAGLAVTLAARLQGPARPRVDTVDLTRLLSRHVASLTASGKPPDPGEARRDARRWSDALNSTLSSIAARDHALVMVAPAVLQGGTDVTNEVERQLTDRRHKDGHADPHNSSTRRR
jgi:Type-F conjugative transfer system protein (TrbI_Ftype).